MSFADNYNIRSSQLSGSNIAQALEALLSPISFSNGAAGLINTSSAGAYVDYTGASISITSASGEMILIMADIALSHGTDQGRVIMAINYDTADQVERYWTASGASTAGNRGTLSFGFIITAPSPGSHTIKLRWQVDAGTAYSIDANLGAYILQNT